MKNFLIISTFLVSTISIAEYSVKIPLEVSNGGNLPNGSLIIGDTNGNGGGAGNNYDSCYDNPSECFDDIIIAEGGNVEENVNVCSFQRRVSIYGGLPYSEYWFDSDALNFSTEFYWDSYMVGTTVNKGERFHNNPEGGIFYRGRFIENIAEEHGGNYYEGQVYEVCYYGPEWEVAPF